MVDEADEAEDEISMVMGVRLEEALGCDLIDALPLADVDTGTGVTASRRDTVGRIENTDDDPAVLGEGREGAGGAVKCARSARLGGGEMESAATGESKGDTDLDGDRGGEGEGDGGAPIGLTGLDLGIGAFRG